MFEARLLKAIAVLLLLLANVIPAIGASSNSAASPLSFSDDFSVAPEMNGWTVHRWADEFYWDGSQVYITRAKDSQSVAAVAPVELTATRWETSFIFLAGGGGTSGGDGFVFFFYKDVAAYDALGVHGGHYKGFHGYYGEEISGYGIEFTTCCWYGPAKLALIHNSVENELASVEDVRVSDGAYHTARVTFDEGHVNVRIDDELVLSHFIENPNYGFSGVGFSGGTGAAVNNHVIDDFNLQGIAELAPPNAPENMSARSALGGQVHLEWAPPPNGTAPEAYRIYRQEPYAPLRFIAEVPANTTVWQDNNRAVGVHYTYAVTAWNAGGESGMSQLAEAIGTGVDAAEESGRAGRNVLHESFELAQIYEGSAAKVSISPAEDSRYIHVVLTTFSGEGRSATLYVGDARSVPPVEVYAPSAPPGATVSIRVDVYSDDAARVRPIACVDRTCAGELPIDPSHPMWLISHGPANSLQIQFGWTLGDEGAELSVFVPLVGQFIPTIGPG